MSSRCHERGGAWAAVVVIALALMLPVRCAPPPPGSSTSAPETASSPGAMAAPVPEDDALAPVVAASITVEKPPHRVLCIAADPNNLPFSNDRLEGFENRVAELIARDLGVELRYTWRAQRRGFFRETLKQGDADLVMGVPAGTERALWTEPYYRSTYVFVTRRDRGLSLSSLDDPELRSLRVGVQVIGDDGNNPPPLIALGRRGIIDNLVGFTVYGDYREPNPPARIIDAVAAGEVDAALVWGPVAGYFAARGDELLRVTPVTPAVDPPCLPMVFDIAIGVRKKNVALRDQINAVLARRRAEIDSILDGYHVPRADPCVQLPAVGDDQ